MLLTVYGKLLVLRVKVCNLSVVRRGGVKPGGWRTLGMCYFETVRRVKSRNNSYFQCCQIAPDSPPNLATLAAARSIKCCQIGRQMCPNLATLHTSGI